jgi:hypothetical protein
MRVAIIIGYAVVALLESRVAQAGVEVCDAALIQTTFSASSSVSDDWRLASLITSSNYDQVKHDAGGQATVYGIPFGANYSDFRTNLNSQYAQQNQSENINQTRNVAWTGLESASVSAYEACLQTQVLMSNGLHAAVTTATASDISIHIRFVVPGLPAHVAIKWSPPSVAGFVFPSRLTQGDTIVRVPRPDKELSVSGNASGYATDALVLEPLPSPIKPIKPFYYDFSAGGFPGIQSGGRRGVPGCACGNTVPSFADTSSRPISHLNEAAGQIFSFRFDNTWICQGQQIDHAPSGLADMDFGNGKSAALPDAYGVARLSYPFPGSYKVTMSTHATCLDTNCRNSCAGSGSFTVDVN